MEKSRIIPFEIYDSSLIPLHVPFQLPEDAIYLPTGVHHALFKDPELMECWENQSLLIMQACCLANGKDFHSLSK